MTDNLKRHVSLIGVFVIVITSLSIPCHAESPIIFGCLPGSPPLSFEKDGVNTGFFTDVFLEACQRAGYDIRLKSYPVKRLESYLQTGKIDGAISLIITPEREAYLVYSKTPVITSRTLVFVKKGLEFPFHTQRDLFGKNIGILLGWKLINPEFEEAVQQGKIHLDPVPGHEQNLKKLMSNRIDCLVGTENLTWHHAHKLGIDDKIVSLPLALAEVSAYVALSKKTKHIKDPQAFMDTMDAALESLISDGTYKALPLSEWR